MFKLIFEYRRSGLLYFLSHLDMLRLFQRALRRTNLPVVYSKGYNPHLQINLAGPIPTGVKARAEYGEVSLIEDIDSSHFWIKLEKQLPNHIDLISVKKKATDEKPLESMVAAASYSARAESMLQKEDMIKKIEKVIGNVLDKDKLMITKKGKKGVQEVDIRPYIFKLKSVGNEESSCPAVNMLLKTGSQGGVSPIVVIEMLSTLLGDNSLEDISWSLERTELFINQGGSLQPLSERM